MEYFHEGSSETVIDPSHARSLIDAMLSRLGKLKRVLLIPPDHTRFHSWAGELTVILYERLRDCAHVEVLPALGTHAPMTDVEIGRMFPGIPRQIFRVHRWREDLTHLGEVPADFVREVSEGKVDFPIPCEINRLLVEGDWDRIISIGQLVPHEVIGIANHNKNILVGTGGLDTIQKTHYLGAVCGMERIMGWADSPVRRVLNRMDREFLRDLPIAYILTVRAKDDSGNLVTRGLFAGDDEACFLRGAELCREVNLDLLDEPIKKAVVYLDPDEYHSTWLGNKAVYRTRMAMADEGELIILAPGVRTFGEDSEIDRLIRKYGYRGTPCVLESVRKNEDLAANLSAAAHLIHGSSEGRFRITYCPGGLGRSEIESVGFEYADPDEMLKRYSPSELSDGSNITPDGEEFFYISNPALGLWTLSASGVGDRGSGVGD
jgi:nickel-dependent lactate racemase